jgi:hypothetical protein
LCHLLLRVALGRIRLLRRWRRSNRRLLVLLSKVLLTLNFVRRSRRRISALLLVRALGRLVRGGSGLRRVLLLLLRSILARSSLLLVLRCGLDGLRLDIDLGFGLGLHLVVVG